MDTPPFGVPAELARTNHGDWTQRQAELYCDWLLDSADARASRLFQQFDVPAKASTHRKLQNLGRALVALLHSDSIYVTQPSVGKLTEPGNVVAADIGLFMGQRLVATSKGAIQWVIYRGKGMPRNAVSRNLPVLENTVQALHQNPLVAAQALCFEGYRMLTRDGNRWATMYEKLRRLDWI